MSEEEQIKDVIEILELAKEEIENNNENITATLDLQDLKSLKNLYDLYNKEKALNEELQIRYKIENDKYNKEKEKNKKLENKIKGKINNLEIFRKTLPIRATEIERFIGELKDLLEE